MNELDDEKSKILSSIVEKVCGPQALSHGLLYGDTFHVKVMPHQSSKNIAYTSLPLCPHQDLAYYESMVCHKI